MRCNSWTGGNRSEPTTKHLPARQTLFAHPRPPVAHPRPPAPARRHMNPMTKRKPNATRTPPDSV